MTRVEHAFCFLLLECIVCLVPSELMGLALRLGCGVNRRLSGVQVYGCAVHGQHKVFSAGTCSAGFGVVLMTALLLVLLLLCIALQFSCRC
jgi:hypothetical protein